jgi:hypothetical protein
MKPSAPSTPSVGAPVLTDIASTPAISAPSRCIRCELPDLFAGTQLVVAGRYREGGPATITLSGNANGRAQTFTYADQTFRDEGGEAFIPRLWATRAIGHLMQQIRLRGEDPELVQSIVSLSTRYGIITPYTSFLIEEDDIAAQTGGAPVLEEAAEMLAAPMEASGAAAVDRASAEGELAAADAPMPMATMVTAGGQAVAQAPVRSASSRTFFLRGDVWVDSGYDGTTAPRVLPFASDAYFDLLSARPELGEALALGEEVRAADNRASAGDPHQPRHVYSRRGIGCPIVRFGIHRAAAGCGRLGRLQAAQEERLTLEAASVRTKSLSGRSGQALFDLRQLLAARVTARKRLQPPFHRPRIPRHLDVPRGIDRRAGERPAELHGPFPIDRRDIEFLVGHQRPPLQLQAN